MSHRPASAWTLGTGGGCEKGRRTGHPAGPWPLRVGRLESAFASPGALGVLASGAIRWSIARSGPGRVDWTNTGERYDADPAFSELPLMLDTSGGRTLQLAVHDALRAAILDRRLDSGGRVPATRDLAHQLGIARGTVVLAYEQGSHLLGAFAPAIRGSSFTARPVGRQLSVPRT
jgi:Bacterial regulatory proteins, gntR family